MSVTVVCQFPLVLLACQKSTILTLQHHHELPARLLGIRMKLTLLPAACPWAAVGTPFAMMETFTRSDLGCFTPSLSVLLCRNWR